MRKKSLWCCLLLVFVLVGCRSATTATQKSNVKMQTTSVSSSAEIKKDPTPTLFVHGYSGGPSSFGGMMARLSDAGYGEKDLVLNVSEAGEVTAEGELSTEMDKPLVQVLFEDNKNNEWNQADWLKACFIFLQQNYQVDAVNLVGHSMGGVSGLRYLTAYGSENNLPQIKKFVAIGAPFNEFEEYVDDTTLKTIDENGPSLRSARYDEYVANIANYPVTTPFLNLAGDLEDGSVSDGAVPVASALSVDSLLRNQGVSVTYQIFGGADAQHSLLHENSNVDQVVIDFLWSE